MTDWDTFRKALDEAPIEIQNLIRSEAPSNFLDELIKEGTFLGDHKQHSLALLGDILLNLLRVGDLPTELTAIGISESRANVLAIKIAEFVKQHLDIISEPISAETEPTGTATNPKHTQLEKLRTMQSDMTEVQDAPKVGYAYHGADTSDEAVITATSQADTLEKRTQLSSVPKYNSLQDGDK